MTYRFAIDGRLPSLNDYVRAERSGWQAANSMKRRYERIVAMSAVGIRQITKPVRIRYTFFEKDRRRDKDNVAGVAHKIVQDALVKAGILANDSWDYVVGFSDDFQIDKQRPRIEIELIEVEE